IGWAATERRLPLHGMVLFVSGRCSFEVVQKAAVAGVPVVAAVSAPSSLAVELADRLGLTPGGFLPGDTLNAYPHPPRVTPPTPSATAAAPTLAPGPAQGPGPAATPASAPGTAARPAPAPAPGRRGP